MRSCRRLLTGAPLGVGVPVPARSTESHSSSDGWRNSDVSSCQCLGVVKRPQVGLMNGVPVWQCQLVITTVGSCAADTAAASSCVVAQEHITLKASGEKWFQFCREHVKADGLVCIRGLLQQRPRYVAIHSNYRYATEVHITEQTGFVEVIAP